MKKIIVMDFSDGNIDIFENVIDPICNDDDKVMDFIIDKGYKLSQVEYMVVPKLNINYK